jgi:hypothetical protein
MMFVPVNGLRMMAVEAGLLLAFTLLGFVLLRFRPAAPPQWMRCILANHRRAVLLVIAIALLGRGLLQPWLGVPHPRIDDEFSYLLMGDTFAHFRLSNPTPPEWQHFETFHVNWLPTYHSKYAVAQGLALGFGEIVFHQPWIGVYLSTALMCGAICWALQAFVPPGWALLAALLATVRLAFFSYWMNSYWGGSMAALGGALALGAAVRLFEADASARRRALLGVLFALALLLLATSRPYEGLAFAIPLIIYFVYRLSRGLLRHELKFASAALPVLLVGAAGLLMMGYYNQRTTGNPLLLPHLLNERTYSPLPLFLWQKAKPPLAFHDPVFAKFFAVTVSEYKYADETSSLSALLWVEAGRVTSDWFFYIGVALSFPVLIGFLSSLRQSRLRLAALVALSTAVGLALCIYTMPHYAAPATVAVYVFAAEGMRYLWEQHGSGERAFVIGVCLTVLVSSLAQQTGSAAINLRYAFPDTRRLIARQLENKPGKQLVLVSYDLDRHYPGNELVHNGADFPSSKILWARSKGPGHDSDLCRDYSDRTFWAVTTDDAHYSLSPLDLCHSSRPLALR